MRIWIDIENAPQVQYLVPLARSFQRAGADVVITARDHTHTLDLLRLTGVPFEGIGAALGRAKWRKLYGTWRRSSALIAFNRTRGVPDAVLSPNRAAILAAWRMGIRSFVFSDYEYANMSVYRLAKATVFHPDVVDPAVLVRSGIDPGRLISYAGLKEDVTFADIDIDAVPPYDLGRADNGLSKVLFRPPAEESHYFREDSRRVAIEVLRALRERDDVLLVYSPRTPEQLPYVTSMKWRIPPVVLDKPVAFLPLLKAVDAVISAGGTMIREAAYLGIPAYSIFQGEIAAIDRYLESIGRLRIVDHPSEFEGISLSSRSTGPMLRSNPHLVDQVTEEIMVRLAEPENAGEEAA